MLLIFVFWVLLKFPNNTTFSYMSKHMERLLDKLSNNTDLLWSRGLYASTISHFLKQRFISRKRVSLSTLREFNCFCRNAFIDIHA